MELDDFMNALGLNYEELKDDEKQTYENWLKVMAEKQVEVMDIRKYIKEMRISIDTKLATVGLSKEEDIFLRARLQNYILLEAFLESPERAKNALTQYFTYRIQNR